MWSSLPFTSEHEYTMQALGYSDKYIRYMKKCHNPDTRNLIVSEVIDNAIKLGNRIEHHYHNGNTFRWLFPEVIPDSSCVWNAKSMTHKRTGKSPNGEGTYDFLGVGSALQSRHYDRVIEDDIFGRDAAHSEASAADAIDYHRKLVGAFDSDPTRASQLNDEIVVGNRWCYNDLNQWIRENEAELNYKFTTHDAEGGCCDKHPAGVPIFPEEWSLKRLREAQVRLGVYDYSCQYRNNPIPDGSKEFDPTWLRYYDFGPMSPTDPRVKIIHHVYNGEVIEDLNPSNLSITIICDPAHADNKAPNVKRCRHAISVIGMHVKPTRIYLLDSWAAATTYHEFVAKIYEFAKKWKQKRIWLETIAAQKYLKLYLDYRAQIESWDIKFEELKVDTSPDAKFKRIRSMNSYYQECMFWCRQAHTEFIQEYCQFNYGKTVDILDTIGYFPQILQPGPSRKELYEFMTTHRSNFENRNVGHTGY